MFFTLHTVAELVCSQIFLRACLLSLCMTETTRSHSDQRRTTQESCSLTYIHTHAVAQICLHTHTHTHTLHSWRVFTYCLRPEKASSPGFCRIITASLTFSKRHIHGHGFLLRGKNSPSAFQSQLEPKWTRGEAEPFELLAVPSGLARHEVQNCLSVLLL